MTPWNWRTLVAGVALDHELGRPYANFSATVSMWERHGGAAVVNTVVSQERVRLAGREFRPAVACQLVVYQLGMLGAATVRCGFTASNVRERVERRL